MIESIANWVRQRRKLARFALSCIPDITCTIHVEPIGALRTRLRMNRSFWLHDPLTHEGFMLGALQRMIHDEDVVYDVGANIGMYCRFMVSQFHARQVICFEPMTKKIGRAHV